MALLASITDQRLTCRSVSIRAGGVLGCGQEGGTYEDSLPERIRRERVSVDAMQPRNRHDRRKRPKQEYKQQRELLLLYPVHSQQRRYGETQDEDVGEDVKAGGEVEKGRRIYAVPVDAGGRDGPEFVEGAALAEGCDETGGEEG